MATSADAADAARGRGDDPGFALSDRIDPAALRRAYADRGHVRIAGFLARDGADRLRQHLAARQDWRQIINSGDKIFELDRETRAAMSAEKAAALDSAVHSGARSGFQHRYEALRVPEGAVPAADRTPLTDFVAFMNSAAVIALMRTITGEARPIFLDGQATAYAPGDFLTAHNDAVAGKGRIAATVFGMTPVWKPEWGGLLLFHRADDVTGMVPAFNALDLFAVPQVHSVSMVTPAAPARRYAVTGWVRLKG